MLLLRLEMAEPNSARSLELNPAFAPRMRLYSSWRASSSWLMAAFVSRLFALLRRSERDVALARICPILA
jgi:hypothetical protein